MMIIRKKLIQKIVCNVLLASFVALQIPLVQASGKLDVAVAKITAGVRALAIGNKKAKRATSKGVVSVKDISIGDVYWTDFRNNVDTEIGKIRPAIVLDINVKDRRVKLVPLTSNKRIRSKHEVLIHYKNKLSKVCGDQSGWRAVARLKSKDKPCPRSELFLVLSVV